MLDDDALQLLAGQAGKFLVRKLPPERSLAGGKLFSGLGVLVRGAQLAQFGQNADAALQLAHAVQEPALFETNLCHIRAASFRRSFS